MEEIYHIEMTRTMLAEDFSENALQVIVSANIGQDSILNLLKAHFHFDANDFDGAFIYVEEQRRETLNQLAAGELRLAWEAFGRLLHAVQDFYSHTNYVALWRKSNPNFVPSHGNRVPSMDADILSSEHLTAARVYYPLEALTYFRSLVPAMKRILPADSHANMNLDAPSAGDSFKFAISAANDRTAITFRQLREQILSELGPKALELFLDKTSA